MTSWVLILDHDFLKWSTTLAAWGPVTLLGLLFKMHLEGLVRWLSG